VICPNCKSSYDPGEVPAGPGRSIKRFAFCECKTVIYVGSREGWERWYAISWSPPAKESRTTGLEAERKEFYQRLEATKEPDRES
jgi:hypothetical protein